MKAVFDSTLQILNESAPFLLLGFALAGVIHVLLARFPRLTAQLAGPGSRPVIMAALIGGPMPLCSCSVLPAAMALRREGASKGTTASFLVSVPETDIVSVLLTLALIGPAVAVYRPVAALASALVTGFFVGWLERREHASAPGAAPIDASCCPPGPEPQTRGPGATVWWRRVYRYGFVEVFDDIIPQLFLGIVVAGALGAWLPELNVASVHGHTVLTYLAMVAVAAPLYVCATASTPIAAGLIAGGVSPGAAMVFLLAGPATNLASLMVLRSEFGARIVAGYLAAIIATSVGLGALLDAVLGATTLPVAAVGHDAAGTSWFRAACAAAFLLWTAVSVRRSRLLPRVGARLARLAMPPSSR